MTASPSLAYDDLFWRVSKIAEKRNAWSDDSTFSLPAAASVPGSPQPIARGLLVFVYTVQLAPESSQPQILHPYARVLLQLDGDLLGWENLSLPQSSSPMGLRFDGSVLGMTPAERDTFIHLYYLRLIDEEGPLHKSWAQVSPEIKCDLNKLFFSFVERPLLPFYRQHAPDFLAFLEAA